MGLDPAFKPETSAAVSRWRSSRRAEKDAISHRGKAARALLALAGPPRERDSTSSPKTPAAALSVASNTVLIVLKAPPAPITDPWR